MSVGVFWDFRNDKPIKRLIPFVDEQIGVFSDNLDDVEADGHRMYTGDYNDGYFWIANKYYAWRFEHPKKEKYPKVDNLIKLVEARNQY